MDLKTEKANGLPVKLYSNLGEFLNILDYNSAKSAYYVRGMSVTDIFAEWLTKII